MANTIMTTDIFLTSTQLSQRWCISPSTLERWRWLRVGLPYIKVGGRIRYRLADIQAYEQKELAKTRLILAPEKG